VSDVIAAIDDPDPAVRARAAEVAVGLGAPAAPVALQALADPDARVVEAGCFALGELGGTAMNAVATLSAVGRDHPDPLCREAAVAALGAIGDPSGLPAILHATSDKPAIRRRAVLALAPFEGPEVDATLERALSDRDWQVRQAAEDLGTGRTTT
jgi:HEAT repeat protein